ncbi:hypothetical protein M885DRAFT_577456 [Pelagophyceae sp. CCMP2097]|nr:hypothetical protein M885DRAFT_577456 [Pelagophyceae sp. CCMP2097]
MYTVAVCAWGIWRSWQAERDDSEAGEAERVAMLKYWAVFASVTVFDAYFDWVARWIPGHVAASLAGRSDAARYCLAKHVVIGVVFLSPKALACAEAAFSFCLVPFAAVAHAAGSRGVLLAVSILFECVARDANKTRAAKAPVGGDRLEDRRDGDTARAEDEALTAPSRATSDGGDEAPHAAAPPSHRGARGATEERRADAPAAPRADATEATRVDDAPEATRADDASEATRADDSTAAPYPQLATTPPKPRWKPFKRGLITTARWR